MRRKAEVPILLTELTQRSERFDRQVTYIRRVDLGQEMLDGEGKALFALGHLHERGEAIHTVAPFQLVADDQATAMMEHSPNAGR